MSRPRRGAQPPERGRRRRRGTRRAGQPVDEAQAGQRVIGRTLLVRGLLVLAVVATVTGATVVGLTGESDRARSGDAVQPGQAATPSKPRERATTPEVKGPVLPRSAPVALRVRSVHIQARLRTLGLQRDGTVEVPPAKHADRPGWYEASPTPGEAGPSVIVGHTVRTEGMPRPVFHDLGKVDRGATIEVARADKLIAVFRVDRVARYPVTHFPADEVYGGVDHAGLRLITYTPPKGAPSGEKNVVVYASLVKSRRGG